MQLTVLLRLKLSFLGKASDHTGPRHQLYLDIIVKEGFSSILCGFHATSMIPTTSTAATTAHKAHFVTSAPIASTAFVHIHLLLLGKRWPFHKLKRICTAPPSPPMMVAILAIICRCWLRDATAVFAPSPCQALSCTIPWELATPCYIPTQTMCVWTGLLRDMRRTTKHKRRKKLSVQTSRYPPHLPPFVQLWFTVDSYKNLGYMYN